MLERGINYMKVFIIEDEIAIREELFQLLKNMGMNVKPRMIFRISGN